MMQAPEFGVDLAAPPRDLAAAVQSLATLCTALNPSLLVAPLAHPRYRRDYKRARTEPMTRSDRVLSSTQWGRHVVGKVSPWLQLDSPHEAIRRRSEEAFKSEIAWAAHLGLQAVLLPPPPPGSANYARLLQWACLSTQHMRFFVRVSIASPREGDGGGGGGSSAADPWRCWDELRTLCEQPFVSLRDLEREAAAVGIDDPVARARFDRLHPAVGLFQWVVDPADPSTLVHGTTTPVHFIQGIGDFQVPNSATAALVGVHPAATVSDCHALADYDPHHCTFREQEGFDALSLWLGLPD